MHISGNVVKGATPELEGINTDEGLSNALESNDKKTVNVIVRVRPLTTVEHANPSVKNIVQCLKDGIVVHGVLTQPPSRFFGARHAQPKPQHFRVDKVFHPYNTQIDVYAACREVVTGVFEGINGSILAYGATGTGKTHTMFGGSMSAAGVVYQALQEILETKERLESEGKNIVTIHCTFLEVYNEEVYDLLAAQNTHGRRGGPLKVQEYGNDDFSLDLRNEVNPENLVVKGLTRVTPKNAEDFAKLIQTGQKKRFVASTHANAESSRSHSILTMEVEVRNTAKVSLGTIGRIRFCDLAGSERAAGTSNSGIRLHEGGNINRSLLALGGVVQALKQRNKNIKRSNYVPYRGSKLTRLLRDCLSGSCRTLLLFCISPSSMNYEETINTMLFAMQAKEIQFLTKRHQFCADSKEIAKSQEALIEELRLELAQTRDELLRLTRGSSFACDAGNIRSSPQHPQLVESSIISCSACLPTSGKKSEQTCAVRAATPTVSPGRNVNHERLLSDDVQQSDNKLSPVSSVTGESQEYVKLKKKLRMFSVEKETLYREMQEAEKSKSELDIRLRQHKWKLARFLSTKRNNMACDVHEGRTASVGVAGLRLAINTMEAESAAQGGEMERLLTKINAIDCKIASTCKELQRKKQHPFLELLLENVKLRQSSTEAECLAAHYHQECRCFKNREEEYAHALGMCVSAIKSLLPLASSSSASKKEAQLALMLAKLPSLLTKDMTSSFERSSNSGSTTASAQLSSDSHRLLAPAENKGTGTQRQPNERKSGSNSCANGNGNGNVNGAGGNATRAAQQQQQRLWQRTNTTTSAVSTMQGRSFGRTKSGILPEAKATNVNKEPFADPSGGTRAPQKKLMSTNLTPARKQVDNKRAFSANGSRRMSCSVPKKNSAPGASTPLLQHCNGTNGVRAKTTLSKDAKTAVTVGAFGRTITENALQERCQSSSDKARLVKRGRTREGTVGLQRSMTTTALYSRAKD